MSIADGELIRFTAPWMAVGFVATSLLGLRHDVRGAVAGFALGAIVPTLVYLSPGSEMASLVDIAAGMLRAPVPYVFLGTGRVGPLVELTLDWWLGGAFGAALAIGARRCGST